VPLILRDKGQKKGNMAFFAEYFHFVCLTPPCLQTMQRAIAEGTYTSTIYGWIKEEKYDDVIRTLNFELQNFPRSRAALSLLAYCYYFMQNFQMAATTYETLLKFHPGVDEYQIYYSQALYKAGLYPEATKAAIRVEDVAYHQRLIMLQAAIKYEQDDLSGMHTKTCY
jgi:tetratricopeptide repeat protein 30